jgi:hypothetical protein
MASPEPATPFDGVQLPPGLPSEGMAATHASPAEPEPETMVGCIRRFIRVQARLKEIAAEEKVLEREVRELSDRVIEMMIEQEMDSPPGVDGMTAYITPVPYVDKRIDPETGEAFTTDDVKDALIAAGLKAMVKPSYNGNTLRSTLLEYAEHGEVPEALARVVELKKRRELRVTPMASSKRKAAPTA